jgi:hypothetical protein|tara:strand:- start:43 stop:246 length:204 start_codon:yes stop_codon:yes gene_type:complete
MTTTVIPAYGRDYETGTEALASWEKGDDWIIADITNPWNGKPCSKRDVGSFGNVMLCFNKLTDILHP